MSYFIWGFDNISKNNIDVGSLLLRTTKNPQRSHDLDPRRAHDRALLLDRMARLKLDGADAVSRKRAELAAKREEAIAALNAEHDRITKEELGRLRAVQSLEEEKIQRALNSI